MIKPELKKIALLLLEKGIDSLELSNEGAPELGKKFVNEHLKNADLSVDDKLALASLVVLFYEAVMVLESCQ